MKKYIFFAIIFLPSSLYSMKNFNKKLLTPLLSFIKAKPISLPQSGILTRYYSDNNSNSGDKDKFAHFTLNEMYEKWKLDYESRNDRFSSLQKLKIKIFEDNLIKFLNAFNDSKEYKYTAEIMKGIGQYLNESYLTDEQLLVLITIQKNILDLFLKEKYSKGLMVVLDSNKQKEESEEDKDYKLKAAVYLTFSTIITVLLGLCLGVGLPDIIESLRTGETDEY